METIYKYPLKIEDKQTIQMPMGADILTIMVQNFVPCIWALVENDRIDEDRFIEIFGTGDEIPNDGGINRKYISSFQQGPFVWHVFERVN